jgi:HK97 family phage portal protein
VDNSGMQGSKYTFQSSGRVVASKDFAITPAQIQGVERIWSPGTAYGLDAWTTGTGPGSALWQASEIYRTQSAVQTAVGFLARNVAQIGLHTFKRVNDTDRRRLQPPDHPVAAILNRPMPTDFKTTTYSLINALVRDISIFDVALWVKAKLADGSPGGLLRIPPRTFWPAGDNWQKPEGFWLSGVSPEINQISGTTRQWVDNDRVVYFHGYSPDDNKDGVTPMRSLIRILQEDEYGGEFRQSLWQNSSRLSGYIQRPVDAPRWGPNARTRFREDWDSQYRGIVNPGGAQTPILEDGMAFVPAGVTPEQAQYIEGRTLTRSETASAYFIQPAMLGVPGSAGFSSMQELHKMLYQDTLGPLLEFIQQEIELQLLSDFPDGDPNTTKIYVEFNINDKLKGSFEEQASQMSTLVGRPVMTANEGRARINLPSLPEGEGLVTPLNVTIGGQANPQTPLTEPNAPGVAPEAEPAPTQGPEDPAAVAEVDGEASKTRPALYVKAKVSETQTDALSGALTAFFARQEKSIVPKIGAAKANGALTKDALDSIWNTTRWDTELSGVMFPLFSKMATAAALATLVEVGEDPEEYDEARTLEWLLANASGVASGINGQTRFSLLKAITEADNPLEAVLHLFDVAKKSRAPQSAADAGTSLAGFGTHEAIQQTGKKGLKTWVVTSDNPRDSHKKLDGTTIKLDDLFSNGGRWPGDTKIRDIKERARCTCDLKVEVED